MARAKRGLLVKVDPLQSPRLRVGDSSESRSLPSFSTPFRSKIMAALCTRKVKMLSFESFDGTTDFDDHLDVYKR